MYWTPVTSVEASDWRSRWRRSGLEVISIWQIGSNITADSVIHKWWALRAHPSHKKCRRLRARAARLQARWLYFDQRYAWASSYMYVNAAPHLSEASRRKGGGITCIVMRTITDHEVKMWHNTPAAVWGGNPFIWRAVWKEQQSHITI